MPLTLLQGGQAWRERAACIGKPLEMFFEHAGYREAELRELCGGCPVRQECLDDALAWSGWDDCGWRGGMSQDERAALRHERTG